MQFNFWYHSNVDKNDNENFKKFNSNIWKHLWNANVCQLKNIWNSIRNESIISFNVNQSRVKIKNVIRRFIFNDISKIWKSFFNNSRYIFDLDFSIDQKYFIQIEKFEILLKNMSFKVAYLKLKTIKLKKINYNEHVVNFILIYQSMFETKINVQML